MIYEFEWNPNKAHTNLNKHRISFQRALKIFHDPDAMSLFDKMHSSTEDRWITLGIDESGILLVVIHTFSLKDEDLAKIRIISARKATKNEVKQYNRQ